MWSGSGKPRTSGRLSSSSRPATFQTLSSRHCLLDRKITADPVLFIVDPVYLTVNPDCFTASPHCFTANPRVGLLHSRPSPLYMISVLLSIQPPLLFHKPTHSKTNHSWTSIWSQVEILKRNVLISWYQVSDFAWPVCFQFGLHLIIFFTANLVGLMLSTL